MKNLQGSARLALSQGELMEAEHVFATVSYWQPHAGGSMKQGGATKTIPHKQSTGSDLLVSPGGSILSHGPKR